MPRCPDLVPIGRISATHGIRGLLRVTIYSGEFDSILSVGSVVLQDERGKRETFEVASAAVHGKKVLLSLKPFTDINQVLHLVGRELLVYRQDLPSLEEGEYYWCDLLGLSVVTDQGETLGELCDIFATGSNDVYVVRSATREFLIPAIEEVVLDVDLVGGVMTIRPLDGLLDL